MRPNSEEEIFNRDLTFLRANVELLAGPPESVAPFWVAPATGTVREAWRWNAVIKSPVGQTVEWSVLQKRQSVLITLQS